jgi:hypothetical protein
MCRSVRRIGLAKKSFFRPAQPLIENSKSVFRLADWLDVIVDDMSGRIG